ncbi:putative threonine--tRNA ligase [Helianthus debilis subsp. tardiflorus]
MTAAGVVSAGDVLTILMVQHVVSGSISRGYIVAQWLFVLRVTLPYGTVKEWKKWETTHFDITKELSNSLSSNALISQVDGVMWHMSWRLEGGCHVISRYSLLIVMRDAIRVGIRMLIFLGRF